MKRAKTKSSSISPIFVNSGVFPWENKHDSHRTFVPECPREKFMNWSCFGLVCRGDSWCKFQAILFFFNLWVLRTRRISENLRELFGLLPLCLLPHLPPYDKMHISLSQGILVHVPSGFLIRWLKRQHVKSPLKTDLWAQCHVATLQAAAASRPQTLLDGQNRQSPIASVQQTRSTLAVLSEKSSCP